ncbi:unnamed protein product [Mytilus edulis]|uniref:Myb/SANT-like DNA-binding domain-containing protein n=1 Tax=Mytilus edulis TaxID=6550 RepID=A0A8S3PYN0_MYTED|nr:unnamed protein product [Mytilus edulis]
MEPEKGKRAANFTEAEKVFLTELVWEDIAKQLNSRGAAQRTANQIKEKWRKSCGAAREEAAKDKAHARTTGGGPPAKAKDPVTQKILELHQGAPNFFGIDGGLEIGMPLPLETINNPFGLNGKEVKSLLQKAREMHVEIQQFLQDYRPSKALPKVGDGIFYNYVDTTKGITEAERDELTSFLSTFSEINFSVIDVPTMVHDTIAFIVHYSDKKENDASELVVLNDPSNYVACSTERGQIIATADSPTLRQVSGSTLAAPRPSTSHAKPSIVPSKSVAKIQQKPTRQTYQELQFEVLKLDKSRIIQEKRKLMSEREKLELEKTLLKLKIKKIKQEMNDNNNEQ